MKRAWISAYFIHNQVWINSSRVIWVAIKSKKSKAMKVEELKMYGKALEMPKEAVKKQMKIVFRLLRKEFGVFGMLKLLIGIRKHSKRIKKQFPDAVKKARQISKVIEKELVMMGALFSAIADKRGRKIAQEFLIDMMRKTAASPNIITSTLPINWFGKMWRRCFRKL